MTTDATDEIIKLEGTIKTTKYFAIAFVIIIPTIYILWFNILNEQPLSKDSSIWGTFGDFMGGVLNPVVALLAFYWLTKSVLIQKTELASTQKILKETEDAQRKQALTQEKKRFEDTFYSLLNQFNSIFDQLNQFNIKKSTAQDSSIIRELHSKVFDASFNTSSHTIKIHREADIFGHYFRILYQMLKYILLNHKLTYPPMDFKEAIKADVSPTEKLYSNIIRSFLNGEVVRLLAVDCMVDEGHDFYKFKQLIERYSLLKHIKFKGIPCLENIIKEYNISAFGENSEVKAFLSSEEAR